MSNLAQVVKGEQVIVTSILASDLKSKLMELGIVVGRELTVLFQAPLGDPIAVDMDGFVLSLRKSEAELITISRKVNTSQNA